MSPVDKLRQELLSAEGTSGASSLDSEELNKDRFQILSLDGGGLKGVFTVSFLLEIEKHLGINITDHIDLIAGTSTGGIIALALGLGYKPEEILNFYLTEGQNIFPRQSILHNIGNLFAPKFSQKKLQEILREYFNNHKLGESRTRLIIPAFDGGQGNVLIFKTSHHPNLKVDYQRFMWEVATATASAPTYFEAFKNDGGSSLIDGGIWANNPSMIALTESLGYLGKRQNQIYMLSIGTTSEKHSFGKHHEKGGILLWASKAVEFSMHGQSISAHNQAYHLLGDNQYLRVNPIVYNGKYKLDKLSKELVGLGQSEARNQINKIERMFLEHKASKFEPEHKICS